MEQQSIIRPKTGWAGFKENWSKDLLSGFLVSLIALPLSLGIAGASNFPPIMGVLTAMVGGIVVAFFAGSELTIKGPAAGLIVIVAGAVEELGKGNNDIGWKLTLGVIVLAGAIQVLFGIFKVAKLADFFPLSAVHGMLAAIGIIIMSKQIHLAVGVSPTELKGKEPLELLTMVPHSLSHMEYHVAIIGLVSLIILFGWQFLKIKALKKIPPALLVLVVGVLMGLYFHLSSDPSYANIKPLVNPGDFTLNFNASFAAISGDLLPIFLKYLLMFTLVGSLESLLTGKAIDLLDPYQRKANLSKDLTAVGIGNMVSGLLGGLPMISEVARSSANISNGGRTRWANFFHGVSLLLFVVLLTPLIKMVPVASLAAMLIFVGFRLAAPKEFIHAYHIGVEQLMIFMVTVIVTICTDLLMGVFAGILLKLIIQLVSGVPLRYVFRQPINVKETGNEYLLEVSGAATFSNLLNIKKYLDKAPAGSNVRVNLEKARYVDHTVLENLHNYKREHELNGGRFQVTGIERHKALSTHPLAARRVSSNDDLIQRT